MPAANLGLVFPWEVSEAIPEDLSEVATQWRWINRNPLVTRLPSYPCDQQEFTTQGSNYRPETVKVTAAAVAGDTTLTCEDVSYIMNGDTLELTFADSTVEMMEVVSDPVEATNQLLVKRGDAGTTAGAIPVNTLLRVIGNSRTGGEKNQKGIAPRHWRNKNWIQTYQHPVEVSGLLMDTRSYRMRSIAPGATPLDTYRMRQLGNQLDDIERSLVYQRGVSAVDEDTKRAKTKGYRQQIADAGGYIYRPVNYAGYTPYDLLRDVGSGPASVGGSPNLYFISTDWIAGLTHWKMPLVRVDMGVTSFNMIIDGFESSFAPGALFIPAPRLKPGTLFATRDELLYLRYMRQPSWFIRGRMGDTIEGDIISRYGAAIDSPEQSRFIEGVTGWAAA